MAFKGLTAADAAAQLSQPGRGKAKKNSKGWMVCCPAHSDRTPSLSLADGRDGILLYHCFAGCSAQDIKTALERVLGGVDVPVTNSEPRREVQDIEDPIRQIMPVPQEHEAVTLQDFYHNAFGLPTKVWTYRLPDNRIGGWVARYTDPEGGKGIAPWSWTENISTGKKAIRMKAMPDPRPLYNLDKITDNTEAPIIWVEGEKAADAATAIFPNWISTTVQGGGNAISLADLTPLYGRVVIIMADHDGPGYDAAGRLSDLLLGRSKLFMLIWPKQWADGKPYVHYTKDDIADHKHRGWSSEEIQKILENGGRITHPLREIAAPFNLIHYDREAERRFPRR